MNDLFRLILQRPGMTEQYKKWAQNCHCPKDIQHLNVPVSLDDLAPKQEDSTHD